MRAIGRWREIRLETHKSYDAAPPRRDAYAVQKSQVSYSEIGQYQASGKKLSLQNADGSPVILIGYDR